MQPSPNLFSGLSSERGKKKATATAVPAYSAATQKTGKVFQTLSIVADVDQRPPVARPPTVDVSTAKPYWIPTTRPR